MRLVFFIFLFSGFSGHLFSQNEFFFANLIDSTQIRKHAEILASDAFEGRNIGQEGQKKATKYIQQQLRMFGLDSLTDGYLQKFSLFEKNKSGVLYFNKIKLNFPEDFGFRGFYNIKHINDTLVKIVSWEKFKKEKTSETSIIITVNSYEDIDFELLRTKKNKNIFFICKNYKSDYYTRYIDKELMFLSESQKIFFINRKKLRGKIKRQNNSIKVEIEPLKEIFTENIISFVEGSDSVLKKEFIVVSAHYDHIGIKDGIIYNGADDNASGTSALLELAKIFQEAKRQRQNPKRSILFIYFTAEEQGLFGSEYYCLNPLIPLNNTVADFNIDMIGRKMPELEKNDFSVYIIGSDKISIDFHNKHEQIANKYSTLHLDYKYNNFHSKERLYYRSDHYSFAKKNIPSIFYFGGFHEDYHKPTDDVEKLNFTKIKRISELIFYTVWGFANYIP